MSLSLRPPESSNVGDDVRRRLEGRVEALEDALSLLDAVSRALGRGVQEDDDARTVREAISQLPRLDEHASRLASVPETEALVRRYSALKKSLERQVAGPSLRAGLTRVLERRAPEVHEPQEGDTVLLDAPTMPSWLRGLTSLAVATLVVLLTRQPLFFGLLPVSWIALNIIFPRERWFAIQPHRLFMSRRINRPLREVKWSEPLQIERVDTFFRVRSKWTELPLSPALPESFASWLALLTGPWLNALSPVKQNVIVLKGANDANGETGAVFVTGEGVLFVPDVAKALVARSLVNEPISVPPWNTLVEALQHARNWNDLGPHLAMKCDGAWLRRGTFTVEQAGPVTLRLNGNTAVSEDATGNRGRWTLVQLTLEPRNRAPALALLENTAASDG